VQVIRSGQASGLGVRIGLFTRSLRTAPLAVSYPIRPPWRANRIRNAGGSCAKAGCYRQLSFRVSVEPLPVLAVRFDEPSQVTLPSGFFLMYLYWMAVFFGSHTVVDQTG
jgi:hypothetical protein